MRSGARKATAACDGVMRLHRAPAVRTPRRRAPGAARPGACRAHPRARRRRRTAPGRPAVLPAASSPSSSATRASAWASLCGLALPAWRRLGDRRRRRRGAWPAPCRRRRWRACAATPRMRRGRRRTAATTPSATRQNVSQTRPIRWRSCETSTIAPSKSLSASASASRMSRSRWLVGSSSSSTFGLRHAISASARRARSPPENPSTLSNARSPGKFHLPRKSRNCLRRRVRRDVAQVVDRRRAFVQRFDRVLGEVADAQVGMRAALAVEQRQLADQRLHQRRLAGAVGAEQADAVAGFEAEADVVQDHRVAVAIAGSRHGSGAAANAAACARLRRTRSGTARSARTASVPAILARRLTRDCACLALAALALKRSMKLCRCARSACSFSCVICCRRSCSARWRSNAV